MSDTEMAAYYHQHKDDQDDWEETPAPSPRRPARRLDVIVSVRFSPAEQDLLRQAATQRGETLSTFIRGAALRATFQSDLVGSVTGIPRLTVQVSGDIDLQPAAGGQRVHVVPAPETVTA